MAQKRLTASSVEMATSGESAADLLRRIASELGYYAREQKPALTKSDPDAFNKARAKVLALSYEAEAAAGITDDKQLKSIRLAMLHLQRNIVMHGKYTWGSDAGRGGRSDDELSCNRPAFARAAEELSVDLNNVANPATAGSPAQSPRP